MDGVTQILRAIDDGDEAAAEELLPMVYGELRRLAQHRLVNDAAGVTLQPTALVHEAYLRLVGAGGGEGRWQGRAHFFGAAAEAMRRILIERARAKATLKRGGGAKRMPLRCNLAIDAPPEDLLDLDEALRKFAAIDPLKANLVKLRFFAGLSMKEAAEILQVSVATAERYWAFARAWLYQELSRSAGADSVEKW